MKRTFAVPTEDGAACPHFGHCQGFAVLESEDGIVVSETMLTPPAHQPGAYPRFLAEHGVTVVLAGGMGVKAQQLFARNGIEVHMGVGTEAPRLIVEKFLRGELKTGGNACNHGQPGHEPSCG